MNYQTETEFAKLLSDYYSLPERRYVLEIGSMVGDTLRQWFNHGDNGMTLVSIDKIVPLPDPRHHLQNAAHAEWESWNGVDGKTVIVIDNYSQDSAVINQVRAAVPCLDFLFIDGGHDYETVKSDYENYAPLVRPGGLIAFHDIQCIPDVKRFWNEVRGEHFMEYCDEGGMGIGVFMKRMFCKSEGWIPPLSPTLHVITRYSREGSLQSLSDSLSIGPRFFNIIWHIVADGRKITECEKMQSHIRRDFSVCPMKDSDVMGAQLNQALDEISDGWVWVLDDDNLVHPDFFRELFRCIINHEGKSAFAFAQDTAGGVRSVGPETMKECSIDQAQFVIHRTLIGDDRYAQRYTADGEFAERLCSKHPEGWEFINTPCTYYNKLRQ